MIQKYLAFSFLSYLKKSGLSLWAHDCKKKKTNLKAEIAESLTEGNLYYYFNLRRDFKSLRLAFSIWLSVF